MGYYQERLEQPEPERNAFQSDRSIPKVLTGHRTVQEYINFLSESYYHVRHTTPLLMATFEQ